jgi:hypothetical protein
MTWRDLKLACLQKMFLADEGRIVTDDITRPYLNSMPNAVNEALQRLSTAGKFIIKNTQISQFPVTNALGNDFSIRQHTDDDIIFECAGARAYYFEVDNLAEIHIEQEHDGEWQEVAAINNNPSVPGRYTAYKGRITDGNNNVRIRFSGNYVYNFRRVAMYMYSFHSDEAVPDYMKEVRYNLREIAEDYYTLRDVIREDRGYKKTTDFRFEGDSIFILPFSASGSYTVYYNAYPEQITAETPDSYVLPLDPDVRVLIPLYVASQLYKDDENDLATIWRNEFEIALSSLDSTTHAGKEEFQSVIGY